MQIHIEEDENIGPGGASITVNPYDDYGNVYVAIANEKEITNIILSNDQALELTKHLVQWFVDMENK